MANDAQNQNDDQGGGEDSGKEFKPITSQDELNRIIGERVKRAKPADYDDLKAKADRLDQIEQANKTEAEKTAERIAKLEQELNSTRATALRARVQAKHGISDEDAELFLTATDEDTLTKQAERLAQRAADRAKNGNRAPLQGRTPTASDGGDGREVARQLFGGGD